MPLYFLILKYRSLEIHTLNLPQVETITFPLNIINHLEVLDQIGFNKLLEKEFSRLNLAKSKVMLLLSDEVVFNKIIPLINNQAIQAEIDGFSDDILFEPDQIIIRKKMTKEKLFMYALNKDLLDSITLAIQSANSKIEAILPITAFSNQNLPSILSIWKKVKDLNFLVVKGKSNKLLIIISLIILAISIGFIVTFYYIVTTNRI